MRTFPIALALCCAVTAPAQVTPTPLDLSAVSGWASSLSAPSANVAWAGVLGWTGSVYWNCKKVGRTIDGGASWDLFDVPEPADLGISQVFAWNADTAWAAFTDLELFLSGGTLWKTTDGGGTWNPQFTDQFQENYLYGVVFYSPDSGVAIGAPDDQGYFEIQLTTDGGSTWNRLAETDIPTPLVNEASSFDMISTRGRNIWFPTSQHRVFHSSDGGYSWSVSEVGTTSGFVLTEFSDALNGVAWHYPGGNPVYLSTDGGSSWTERTIDPPLSVIRAGAVPGVPGAYLFKAGGSVRLYATTDDFATWWLIDDTQLFIDSPIRMYNAGVGWTCSGDPTTDMAVFRLDDLLSDVNEPAAEEGVTVFPNPVRCGAAMITFPRSMPGSSLQLFDATGRILREQPLSGEQRAAILDVHGIQPGTYFVRVNGNGPRSNMRLIVQ